MNINEIMHYNKLGETNDVLLDISLTEEEKQMIHKYYLENYKASNEPDYNVEDVSVIVFVSVTNGVIGEVDTYFYPSDFGEHKIEDFLSDKDKEMCINYVKENFIGKEHNFKQC